MLNLDFPVLAVSKPLPEMDNPSSGTEYIKMDLLSHKTFQYSIAML
jgi:hypothetical protein